MTGELVLPLEEPMASTAFTTSMPFDTLPNTTCLPSNQEVTTVHRKNCTERERKINAPNTKNKERMFYTVLVLVKGREL